MKHLATLSIVLGLFACKKEHDDQPAPRRDAGSAAKDHAFARADFNRLAARADLPIYWIGDADGDGAVDPDEVASLAFYPTSPAWVKDGAFTPDYDRAYEQLVAAAAAPPPDDPRLALVQRDLDQGRPTLVLSDLRGLSADDKAFVDHMLTIATLIDQLYDHQSGAAAIAAQVPADALSQSLFRRNRGPGCAAAETEHEPLCSAIPGAPKVLVDAYPAALQASPTFCQDLEQRPDAETLLTPFTVVRGDGAELTAVPYPEAYADEMRAIAAELTAAAAAITDPTEQPLVTYLRAAAASFASNDWLPADEAWAKMTAENSKWYVRVGPDEVYWEPCAHKAGFHLTFARINPGSLAWQTKLVPELAAMEAAVAAAAGKPYEAREVSFHLPDFIDIIVNAGDDREPLGATVGQSLPNWGPVANEGRGRTVAMSNLYTDPDSLAAYRDAARSLLDTAAAAVLPDDADSNLLGTILHEATHNLGPAHEYRVGGKKDEAIFGGPDASMLEELKAQTGAMFLLELLRGKHLVDDTLIRQTYVDSIMWAFGQIAQGLFTATHERKPYPTLAAIQLGFLVDHGAMTFGDGKAANGTDAGAFAIDFAKVPAVVDEMMQTFAGIKARGDAAAATALIQRYADGTIVPFAVIAERMNRQPRPSFVYAVLR